MKPCCYVAGCRNPVKSGNTMACIEHAQYVCEICGRQVGLVRDHDHACHRDKMCIKCFRGFLCPPCNSGLGMFQDDPGLLRAAAAYLERPRVAVVRVPPERKVWPGSQKKGDARPVLSHQPTNRGVANPRSKPTGSNRPSYGPRDRIISFYPAS
jgi:Recombination endonuclease VII